MKYLGAIIAVLVLSSCTSTVTCHYVNSNTNPPTCYQGQFTQCPPAQLGWLPGACGS